MFKVGDIVKLKDIGQRVKITRLDSFYSEALKQDIVFYWGLPLMGQTDKVLPGSVEFKVHKHQIA